MNTATQVIFRRITGADFFNIYKAPGTEVSGGGQSYIDIDTSGVPISAWYKFFTPVTPTMKTNNFPAWNVNISSIGIGKEQTITIGQRRNTSVSIRSQKIASRRSIRIHSWHPNYGGFPAPTAPPTSSSDPAVRKLIVGLVIFLVRDQSGGIWAGWFNRESPSPHWKVDDRLKSMFVAGDGYIDLGDGIPFDGTNVDWPFGSKKLIVATTSKTKNYTSEKEEDDEIELSALFDVDEIENPTPKKKEVIRKIRVRNSKAAKILKKLYGSTCQISGDEFVFLKPDGTPYIEVHHLIPLGAGGADSPENLIVVSAHIHKMLHYANVPEIDLSKIKENKLNITINQKKHTITWHPKHDEIVINTPKKTNSSV